MKPKDSRPLNGETGSTGPTLEMAVVPLASLDSPPKKDALKTGHAHMIKGATINTRAGEPSNVVSLQAIHMVSRLHLYLPSIGHVA